MGTSYDEIRDRFLIKIIDYDFMELDENELNEMFDIFLKNAIPKFRYCRKNLKDRDEITRKFNEVLSDMEQDILSSLCVLEWMEMQVNNKMNYEKFLSTKDFHIHSPATHLREINKTKDNMHYRINSLINYYRFDESASEV